MTQHNPGDCPVGEPNATGMDRFRRECEDCSHDVPWSGVKTDDVSRGVVSGAVPIDDSPSAVVIADVPGAQGRLNEDGWAWFTDAATLTFVELPDNEADGRPVAQIALYAGREPTTATSIEIDRADARALIDRLLGWIENTDYTAPLEPTVRTPGLLSNI